MKAKRVALDAYPLNPGEYRGPHSDGSYLLCTPSGIYGTINSKIWTIKENPDGTLTVAPSIWVDKPNGWHGFLENDIWRDA